MSRLAVSGTPIRSLQLENNEAQQLLRELSLLTAKPVLYVANVDESDVTGQGPLAQKVRQRASR